MSYHVVLLMQITHACTCAYMCVCARVSVRLYAWRVRVLDSVRVWTK